MGQQHKQLRRSFLPGVLSLLLSGSSLTTTTLAFVVPSTTKIATGGSSGGSSSSSRFLPSLIVPCSSATLQSRLDASSSDDSSLSSSSTTTTTTTTTTTDQDEMRHDIEVLRQQAQERLMKLSEQMEELKHQKKEFKELERHQVQEERKKHHEEEEQELLAAAATATDQPQNDVITAGSTASASASLSNQQKEQQQPQKHRLDLLDDTRWKIVFNLGREAGTWMPPDWGASGARLLFEVVVDFTPVLNYNERDEFFQGVVGCKELHVVDAWMFPVGVGTASVGRRKIAMQPVGTFKVLAGQGPQGTDIVRLCLEIQDEHVVHDDVICPVGRIYGTCGYFPLSSKQSTAWKDQLAQDHHAVAIQYEQLKAEDEQDDRLWNKLARMRELFKVRKQLEKLAAELQHARQLQPDRSELRLSRNGQVGLSREGGVCRKVHKGLAIEYHILGRMEVASVNKEHDEQHDEYEELVHESMHP